MTAPDGSRSRRPSPGLAVGTMFAANLVLALVWVAMTGRFDLENLALGFAFGYLLLFVGRQSVGGTAYFTRSRHLLSFIGYYALEVIRANIRVAIDVVTPRSRAQPGIVAVPLDARTDAEITLLANLITMTPGSLSLDVSDDRQVLYVHVMFLDDPEAYRRSVKHDFERRVLELLR